MSKSCLNCGREISGEGKNKVFCDDCFSIMAAFLRQLPSSNESAMTLYERNRPRFRAMGISDRAALYIEKCCQRYDSGPQARTARSAVRAPAKPIPQAEETTDSGADDYPDPIELPRRRGGAAGTAAGAGFAAVSDADRYALPKRETDEETPYVPTPPYQPPVKKRADELTYDDPDDDYDGYDGGGGNGGAGPGRPASGSPDPKRRLYIILAAALTAVVIFALLAFSGALSGKRPAPNGGDESTSGSHSDDTFNAGDTGGSGTAAGPADTDGPVGTGPVGPADTDEPPETECVHEWAAATCTEPQKCVKCGATQGAPLEHSYKAATCTEPAVCTRCGQTTGQALGHSFTQPTCAAHGKCTRCRVENTADKLLDHDYAPATCTTPETCRVCNAVKSGSTPLGHDWLAEASFEWSEDGESCSVTYTCSRDASHTSIGAATVTEQIVKEATCTETGVRTQTASASFDGKEYRTSRDVEIPLAPHTYDEGSVSCKVCGAFAEGIHATDFSEVQFRGTDIKVAVVPQGQSGNKYTLTYTVINSSSSEGYAEGCVKLILSDGTALSPSSDESETHQAGESEIFASGSCTHTLTFDIPEGETVILIEYYDADFSRTHFFGEDRDKAIYWAP